MGLGDVDARIVTAVCLWLIGTIVVWFTLKVWWMNPARQALLFGPYLRKKGLEAVMRGWPALFLLGASALAGGAGRFVYWLRWRHLASDEWAAMAGIVEASFSLWAAGALSIFAIRTWRSWKKIVEVEE